MFTDQPAVEVSQPAYWREKFPAGVSDLDLPADRPRPAVRVYVAERCRRRVDFRLAEKLRPGLEVALLAGLQALLSRLSRETEVVVSVGKNGEWVPLRAALSGEMTFMQFVEQQRACLAEAVSQGAFPYSTLAMGRASLGGVCFSVGDETATAPECDLTLRALEQSSELTLEWEYNAALYDDSTMARWLEHLEILLAGAMADPAASVQALPLLSTGQKQKMLVEWNSTAADYPRDRCVHELIEEQVERTPGAVAAQFVDQTITYRELSERSNRLARYLVKHGVVAGSVVGIYLERSLDMLVGMLAILIAGAGYLPIDPEYPKERIEFIMQDARVPVLLTQSSLAATTGNTSARLVAVDGERDAIAAESAAPLSIHSKPNDVAYMIYTSGSTGKPKGVEVPHQALVNLLASMAKVPGIGSQDVLLAVTTLCFDISAMEIFLPLTVGARLVIARREVAGDPLLLKQRLLTSGATIMQATPVTWRILLEAGWDGAPLKKIFCGGEALPRELAEQLLKLGPEVWNMYGPTETTIWSSTGRVSSAAERVPIGPPIDNTQLYILDGRQQPVPIGVVGELCIAGDGVANGYHNRPELTSERFVANPFRPGERMYRTGDLARYLPDGTVDFLGRLDHQVKLRGYRIELGEIESVLAKHPAIKQSVVTVREFSSGNQRLVAYLVPANGSLPSRTELDAFAEAQLPEYMVPGAYVSLAELPLTANGKIDRKALPAPDRVLEVAPTALPQSELEEKIAGIWRTTLSLTQVGVEDRFFDLGGDSLQLISVKNEIEKAIAREITVVELFEYPTIRALASHLDKGPNLAALAAAQESGRKQSQSWARFKPVRQKA
jgi:amino acid adenylation domain-containing protein